MKKLVIVLLFCILLTSSVSADGYNIFYYHNDHLGNPVAITNEDGEVVWKADYEPFGEIFNEENIQTTNKYNYNTKELDKNTNLLYYGNRFYDSNIGRFTTADTVKGSLGAPQSLNRYAYTLNNPLKYIDPSGNEVIFAQGAEALKSFIESEMLGKSYNYETLVSSDATFTFKIAESDSLVVFQPTTPTIIVSPKALQADPKELQSTLDREFYRANEYMNYVDLQSKRSLMAQITLKLVQAGMSNDEIGIVLYGTHNELNKLQRNSPNYDFYSTVGLNLGMALTTSTTQAEYEKYVLGKVSESTKARFLESIAKVEKYLEDATDLSFEEESIISSEIRQSNLFKKYELE